MLGRLHDLSHASSERGSFGYLTKRLKDQLLLVFCNAAACVLHTELHHVHAHPSRRQGFHSHPDVPFCCELQGVTQQVEDDLQAYRAVKQCGACRVGQPACMEWHDSGAWEWQMLGLLLFGSNATGPLLATGHQQDRFLRFAPSAKYAQRYLQKTSIFRPCVTTGRLPVPSAVILMLSSVSHACLPLYTLPQTCAGS